MSIFHIAIANKLPAEPAFLPMDRYEAEELLYRVGLDAPGAEQYIDLYSDYSGIHMEPCTDFRAMNRLAQRISDMDEGDRAAFRAWGKAQGVCSVEDALKATYHMGSIIFFPDVGSDEALGELALANGMFEDYNALPEDIYSALDKAKAGARMREQDGGRFVDGGYLVVNEDFSGEPIPAEEPMAYFQARFSDGQHDSGWCGVPLSADDDSRIAAMLEHYPGLEMECRSIIPHLNGIVSETSKLPGLCELAAELNNMSGEEIQKYKVLLEAARPESLGMAFRLAITLDRYAIALEYADPAAYAVDFLEQQFGMAKTDPVMRYIDLAALGRDKLLEANYELTRYGAIYCDVMAQSVLAGPNTIYGGAYYCCHTVGYPTFVCWDPDAQKVWLELGESIYFNAPAKDFPYYQQICEKWGMRPCASEEDYERIISSLDVKPFDKFMEEAQDNPRYGWMGGMAC